MKKSVITAVVFLLTIPVVYAQQIMPAPQGAQEVSFRFDGNTLMFRSRGGGASMVVNFEGKLNGKTIEFKQEGFAAVSMNDGTLSDEETRLVGSAIDIMKSACTREKFDTSGMSFKLKGEGNALHADIKSGAAVFEGKIGGTINEKPFDFKSDAGGAVIVNDGALSDIELKAIEFGFGRIKNALVQGKLF